MWDKCVICINNCKLCLHLLAKLFHRLLPHIEGCQEIVVLSFSSDWELWDVVVSITSNKLILFVSALVELIRPIFHELRYINWVVGILHRFFKSFNAFIVVLKP